MRDNVNIRRDVMRYNVRGIPILVSSTDFVLPYFEGSLYGVWVDEPVAAWPFLA